MRTYRCSGCGVTNRAINDLTGMRHTQTNRKPSNCEGRYALADQDHHRDQPAQQHLEPQEGDASWQTPPPPPSSGT